MKDLPHLSNVGASQRLAKAISSGFSSTFVENFRIYSLSDSSIQDFGKRLITSMTRFGLTSLLGTALDFLTFTFLFHLILPIFWAEIAAAMIGMVVNFLMQKRFVFALNRKLPAAFLLSIGFSVVFMFLGAWAIEALSKLEVFAELLIVAKLLVMGSKFVVNFFTKKWIFEKDLKV